jgi:FlaA1/EpsC-like NDP-sugar epimerase
MLDLSLEVQQRLLDRPVRDVLTAADRAAFRAQRILVTGAGGSLGGELSRQLAACEPATLTLVDHSEYALFRIEQELRQTFPSVTIDAVVGDVSRRVDIASACRIAMPHVVYHAAAYKHVPIAERAIVPAARTNVIGTVETVRAARESGARFVLISSDKAAEPRSVMGATKRCAELVALAAADGTFRPIVMRFGNILGSSGSLVEVMSRCVSEGRNVPVTNPDATRFFMTGAEAVSLILKADLIGRHPEVFWLDMGKPLRIGTLAERFIEWTTPEGTPRVGIDIIGLRPGEKMHEELTTHGLEMQPTSHPRIMRARQAGIAGAAAGQAVRSIRSACACGDAARVLDALMTAVIDFIPSNAALEAAAGRHEQCVEHVRLSAVAAGSSAATSFRH